MSDGGKGSKPRPYSVDQKTFDSNWDTIFKKKTVDHTTEEPFVMPMPGTLGSAKVVFKEKE